MTNKNTLKYRIVRSADGVPASDWTTDKESLDAYLTQRPDWIPELIVVGDTTTTLTLSKDELDLIVNGLSTYHGLQYNRLKAQGLNDAVHNLTLHLIDIRREEFPGEVCVINASGRPMMVPKEEAYMYNGNDDAGIAIFGFPPNATAEEVNELLDRQAEAIYEMRFDEFENAAETADQISKLNDALPNDEPEVWYIDKHQ